MLIHSLAELQNLNIVPPVMNYLSISLSPFWTLSLVLFCIKSKLVLMFSFSPCVKNSVVDFCDAYNVHNTRRCSFVYHGDPGIREVLICGLYQHTGKSISPSVQHNRKIAQDTDKLIGINDGRKEGANKCVIKLHKKVQ